MICNSAIIQETKNVGFIQNFQNTTLAVVDNDCKVNIYRIKDSKFINSMAICN